jgi:hypothetical protein
MNKPVFLSSGDVDATPAITLGQGFPKEVNGLPASYYWRKSLRDGDYKHPVAGWELSVTPEYRKKLADTFKRTTESGLQFPIQRNHNGMGMGFLLDVKNEGDALWELHQYLGDDARVEALRNRVSVGIHPNIPDSRKGKQWGEGIFHTAIVPDPVVSGQGEAIRVMSSNGQHDAIDVLTLANKGAAMPAQFSQEQFDTLKAKLGGGENVTPETLYATLLESLDTKAASIVDSASKLLSLTAERDEARAALVTAETKVREFSTSAPNATDPIVMSDRAESFADLLGGVRDAGHITPACAEKLAKLRITDNKPDVRLLSSSNGEPPIYKALIEALKLNKVMEFGASARAQVLNLPNDPPPSDPKADDEAFKKRLRDAGLMPVG